MNYLAGNDVSLLYKTVVGCYLWRWASYSMLVAEMRRRLSLTILPRSTWSEITSVYYLELANFRNTANKSLDDLISSAAIATSIPRWRVNEILNIDAQRMVDAELANENTDVEAVMNDNGTATIGRLTLDAPSQEHVPVALRYLLVGAALNIDMSMFVPGTVFVNSVGIKGNYSVFDDDKVVGSLGIPKKLKKGVLYGGILPKSERYSSWLLGILKGMKFVLLSSLPEETVRKLAPSLAITNFHSVLIVSSHDVDISSIKQHMLDSVPEFPFRASYMPSFEVMYERLRNIALKLPMEWACVTTDFLLGTVKSHYPEDYENTISIADHYAESARIKCKEGSYKRGNKLVVPISPYDAWVGLMLSPRRDDILSKSKYDQREDVWVISKGCRLFSASLAAYVWSRFAGKGARVLDPSSGWGDRLIGACAAGVSEYVHFDPNPDLPNVYDKIHAHCQSLGAATGRTFYPSKFEDSTALFKKGGKYYRAFDMVFTSPPFASKELYIGTEYYSSVDEWYEKFFDVLVRSSFDALRSGGWLALYLPTSGKAEEANRMWKRAREIVTSIDKRTTMHKLGYVQLHNGEGQTRTTFMWRKM